MHTFKTMTLCLQECLKGQSEEKTEVLLLKWREGGMFLSVLLDSELYSPLLSCCWAVVRLRSMHGQDFVPWNFCVIIVLKKKAPSVLLCMKEVCF